MTNHIDHFEIFANDVERARRFYERVFAWRFEIGGPPDFSDWTDATRTESRRPVSNPTAQSQTSTRQRAAAAKVARPAR